MTGRRRPESLARRFGEGLVWGGVATVVMSVPMVIGSATGLLPMPEPVPVALVQRIFGAGLSGATLLAASVGSHLLYGGVAGGVLSVMASRVTVGGGLGWGLFLWLVMGVTWLPFLGWGLFGTAVSPGVGVATLLLHGVYGAVLGWRLTPPRQTEGNVSQGGERLQHRSSTAPTRHIRARH